MLHQQLRRKGWAINHKLVYRLYREEGLLVRRRIRSASPRPGGSTSTHQASRISAGEWTSSRTRSLTAASSAPSTSSTTSAGSACIVGPRRNSSAPPAATLLITVRAAGQSVHVRVHVRLRNSDDAHDPTQLPNSTAVRVALWRRRAPKASHNRAPVDSTLSSRMSRPFVADNYLPRSSGTIRDKSSDRAYTSERKKA